ncbi:DUF2538 family protein, partial [Staphylococcus epidermidis]|uniref:DUF2538 family protein n=1 Tax=Staphylococcus epidermidis TaxID=1282 RepID=UPI0037DA203E
MPLFTNEFFYLNHQHTQNYQPLFIYYNHTLHNPLLHPPSYILPLPQIFNNLHLFDSHLPFTSLYHQNPLSDTIKTITV